MRTTSPFRLIIIIIMSVAATFIFRDYCLERIFVASASMEPTLPVNSRWWADKLSLRLRRPNKGEIVVLPSPVSSEKDLLKRVIAVGGDTVEIIAKAVHINGRPIEEPYVQHTRQDEMLEGDNLGPLSVPPGHVFLLGDNRDESGDSRDWKDPATGKRIYFIAADALKGRIIGAPQASVNKK
ncbi:MAG: signal peptidase I [Elusimicrobia bacterium]|nr:signal peptidase I [Elusimicrobiota bacterium]